MKYKCKTENCNNDICYDTWKYGSSLCRSCVHKGKHLSENTKKRIAKTSKKRWKDPQYRKKISKAISKANKGKKRKSLTKIHKENIRKALKGKYIGKLCPAFIDGRTNRKYYCKICDKLITIYSKSRMCKSCINKGKKLSKKHISKISLGKGGTGIPYEYYKYPACFYKLKDEIKKRDNYTCQLCGITEEEYLMVHGILLDIHHIDYDKWNSNKENLITLCRGCNSRVNINRNYWKKYFQRYIIKILKKEV